MSKVIMKIGLGGKVEMRTEGVAGATCRNASHPYREMLAGRTVSDTPTEEMNQSDVVVQEDHEQESQ